jgi:cytochrome c6
MKRIAIAAALLAAATLARAEGAGADVYAKRCAMCHGKDGKPTSVGTKMGASDLTAGKRAEADVAKVVTEGKGKMTGFKDKLSEAEISAVAKYVAGGLK